MISVIMARYYQAQNLYWSSISETKTRHTYFMLQNVYILILVIYGRCKFMK